MPPRRRRSEGLERVLGTPALSAPPYGNVGSSIDHAPGVTAAFEKKTEKLEIVEIEVDEGAAAVGRLVEEVRVPESARLISVVRDGRAGIPLGELRLRAGDQVIAILEPGGEDALRRALVEGPRRRFPPV